MMAQNEELLRRSEGANLQTQLILNQVLSPKVLLYRMSPDLNQALPQDVPEPPQIKEEPKWTIKVEEEEPPVSVLECTGLCVKTEESSDLQQIKSEQQEETRKEDVSSEPHLFSQTEGHKEISSDTDTDDDWEPPVISSAAQKKTEADGDQHNQIHNRKAKLSFQNKFAAKKSLSVKKGETSGNERGGDGKEHLCFVCHKRFGEIRNLKKHMQIHKEERSYRCSTCDKSFAQKEYLEKHTRRHTGLKPYRCFTCDKTFAQKQNLERHTRTHTGERPYRCSTCDKTFTQEQNLKAHARTHTGLKPYKCFACDKTFTQKQNLEAHSRTHTGERPFRCSTCERTFSLKGNLVVHTRTHTGVKPYRCSICDKTFTVKRNLELHTKKTHRREAFQVFYM